MEKDIRAKMDKVIESVEMNLRRLRIGRASQSMLESIKVEAYGSQMPLNQVATISVQDAKTLSIQVWDKGNVEAVVKAINSSSLGMTPILDIDIIRLNVPDLTEERRKELTKVVGNYEEEGKVSLRQVRKDAIENIKKDNESTEDDLNYITETADRLIKEYNTKISQLADKKRAEMMEV